ncbi:WW domain protein (macronuclear) [Tetrahymena thermophila SB210]|uniref:WW domain protein n=1 Tax=Tetrahymena thermophila (strain SB210) TaxID=312017 RepID=I7LX45_TETTS|nr:WW domain protein [Tetrahymena thermophila SB210]EAS03742.2 WW domain protein [Tetrahymena thermophila SB210]|eukprot:XP_001023987.2 WW domain protein [Tetrahymena thermophila SB210]
MNQIQSENKYESIVLEEEIENYEPTEEEIFEYASYLGMDLENEKELLWIARNGLKAPLPQGWKPCQTQDEEIYYFNFDTGESRWDHPCDEQFRKLYLEEKNKLYQKRAQTTFQLKDIAAEPITEDDFEDELETCERKKDYRKSSRGINGTQRSSNEGEKVNKEQMKKQNEQGQNNSQLIDNKSQKENNLNSRNEQFFQSDKKNQKNQNNILNESKLHLTKSPANLTSSLYASTIEDPSQIFSNNQSIKQKINNQNGQKYFNSVKKQLEDVNESKSILFQNQDLAQEDSYIQQKQLQIDQENKLKINEIQQQLENDFAQFQKDLERNFESQKQEIIKVYSDRIADNKIKQDYQKQTQKNKIIQELEQFKHTEILNQQQQLQNNLLHVRKNYEENTKIFEEEIEQLCVSKLEQLESEIKDLKQIKEDQEKGIQNIEKDHQEILKQLSEDFEKQKIEVNQKVEDQIKKAIEKEQKNFEKDLESFQLIWEQQFQIQEMSPIEEEAYRQTTKIEFEKKYKEFQIDLLREQENKRHLVFDRIRKEEIINFEKNKMKKKNEYEIILEEKRLEIQKLLASQENLFEKEVRQLENKQKEKFEEFSNVQVKQLENQILNLEQQKQQLIEQIQKEEPVLTDIQNLDIQLHQIINSFQNSIDELNDRKNKLQEEIIKQNKTFEDIQKQKQEQESVLNEINLQILNQENINQQLAFQMNLQQKNLEDEKKAEVKLRQTLEQFRSNNYFSQQNNLNLFADEQNSFGYKIDESSIINNEDLQNNTEIDRLQKEVEQLKSLIQKEDNPYRSDQNYYSNKENNAIDNISNQQEAIRKRMEKRNYHQIENQNINYANQYKTIQNDKEYYELIQKRDQLLRDRKQFLFMQQQNLNSGQIQNDPLTKNILNMMDQKIQKINLKIKQYEQELKYNQRNIQKIKGTQYSSKKNYHKLSNQEDLEEQQINMEGFSRIM